MMSGADVRRWMASFEAIGEADREAMRRQGPDPAWAVRISLSMIEAADGVSFGRPDPTREMEAERVRAIWDRLRRRLTR